MKCRRCYNQLSGRQTSYCSPYCGKLFLKSLYRKRHRERIREYNKQYKSEVRRYRQPKLYGSSKIRKYLGVECRICKSTQSLTINHIRPLSAGGTNALFNLETLCQRCNTAEFHKLVRAALTKYFSN